MIPAQRIFVAAMFAAVLGGCANNIPPGDSIAEGSGGQVIANTTMRLESAAYQRTFTDTRDVLRDYGFILDRVDAQAGVITTQPKTSAGLATPWNKEQSTFAQELEDLGQRNKRVVRVEFIPTGAPADSVHDLRHYSGELELRCAVDVYRWYQSNWRLNTLSILDSSYAYDPQLADRNMVVYGVGDSQDPALAERVVFAVRERTEAPVPVAAPTPTPEPAQPVLEPQPVQQDAPAPMQEPVAQPAQTPPTPAPAPTPQEPEWRKGDPIKKP